MSDNSLAKTETYITSKQVMFSSVTDKQFMVGTAIGLLSIPFLWWWSGSIFALLFLYLLWHGFREWKEKNDLIDARFSDFVKELWYDRPLVDFIPEQLEQEINLQKQDIEIKPRATPERPNLITSLVIDSANADKVDFHIEIENKGKVDAKNIRVSFYADGFMDVENIPFISRMLPHGGKLSIPTLREVFQLKDNTSLVIKVFYNVDSNGLEKHFLQKVRFFIRDADIKVQTIYPEAWEENEGDAVLNEQQSTAFVDEFCKPMSNIVFVLPEINKDGSPNMLSFGNKLRSFSFNTITRIVSLKVKTQSGRLVSLDLPLMESKSGNHLVLITWDYSKGGILNLDGIEKQDMEEDAE